MKVDTLDVDLTSVHGLPPQAVRAIAALSDRCNRHKSDPDARVTTLAACFGAGAFRAWHRRVHSVAWSSWAEQGRPIGRGLDLFERPVSKYGPILTAEDRDTVGVRQRMSDHNPRSESQDEKESGVGGTAGRV